jgi:hypothetical protein
VHPGYFWKEGQWIAHLPGMLSPLQFTSLSFHVSFLFQEGACPLKKEDSKSFPFTSVSKYDSLAARLHFMFGNLSRVDVRQNTGDKKIYCNWFCKDNDFILRANRLPLYGPLYFPMLYEVLKGWSHVGKRFLNVKSDEEIDDLMDMQVNM